jgi:hypothetical protein
MFWLPRWSFDWKHSKWRYTNPNWSWHTLASASENKLTSFWIASLVHHASFAALMRSWHHSVPQAVPWCSKVLITVAFLYKTIFTRQDELHSHLASGYPHPCKSHLKMRHFLITSQNISQALYARPNGSVCCTCFQFKKISVVLRQCSKCLQKEIEKWDLVCEKSDDKQTVRQTETELPKPKRP